MDIIMHSQYVLILTKSSFLFINGHGEAWMTATGSADSAGVYLAKVFIRAKSLWQPNNKLSGG